MVTIPLTPKQAQALYLYITPRQDVDHLLLGTMVTTTQPTIPYRVHPDALEGLRTTALIRTAHAKDKEDYHMWRDILYAITDAIMDYNIGFLLHDVGPRGIPEPHLMA